MQVPLLDLKQQYNTIKPEIDAAIADTVNSGAFVGGESVLSFMKNYAAKHRAAHCISCGNGTDALYIALRSLGVQSGCPLLVFETV